ncbi:VOC family protein [Marinobacter sp. F3R08]|uniref:VOC family protein n=1 Tax=Marinobacter sp. F3R08 TaxID=2841559 RepID=UPI001C084EAB|nr:VOC family protein [Marinobacter sp. F3R08]MBU2952720.1 VOC family protein [Marinobacter sp. F3R08]
MASSNINSVFAVVSVTNQDDSVGWYTKLLGRDPDIVPAVGVAEWQLADSAWLQVTEDSERAGTSTVIVGVNDIETQCRSCAEANVSHGEVIEYPDIIKMIDVLDPDGNKIAFVQDISSET